MNSFRVGLSGWRARILAVTITMALWLGVPGLAAAGPVDWQEVPATAEGRQWWDAGSLRFDRQGRLSVLSRFQPAPPPQDSETAGSATTAGSLYVMQLDCDQDLYRDTSVNGIPQWQPEWRPVAGDGLTAAVLHEACNAAR